MDRPGRSYAVVKDGVISIGCNEGLRLYMSCQCEGLESFHPMPL